MSSSAPNGNTYREYELALAAGAIAGAAGGAGASGLQSQELGTTRPYQWAIHDPTASDGKRAAACASDVLGPAARWDRAGAGAIFQALQRQESGARRARRSSATGRTRRKRRGRMRASGSGGRRCRTWRWSTLGSRRGWITGAWRPRASGPGAGGASGAGGERDRGAGGGLRRSVERQREQRLRATTSARRWWPKCA